MIDGFWKGAFHGLKEGPVVQDPPVRLCAIASVATLGSDPMETICVRLLRFCDVVPLRRGVDPQRIQTDGRCSATDSVVRESHGGVWRAADGLLEEHPPQQQQE